MIFVAVVILLPQNLVISSSPHHLLSSPISIACACKHHLHVLSRESMGFLCWGLYMFKENNEVCSIWPCYIFLNYYFLLSYMNLVCSMEVKVFFQEHVNNLLKLGFCQYIPSSWKASFNHIPLSIQCTYVHTSYIPYVVGELC